MESDKQITRYSIQHKQTTTRT